LLFSSWKDAWVGNERFNRKGNLAVKKLSRLAWILCGVVAILSLVNLASQVAGEPGQANFFELANKVTFALVPIVFAFLAALVLTRQPQNVIGWLLMLPALSVILPAEAYVRSFHSQPAQPSALLLLAVWLVNWGWMLLIFPVFFILLLFPTGKPSSPRWRWLLVAGLGMIAIFLFVVTFAPTLEALDLGWSVVNPIGFLPADTLDKFTAPWAVGLVSLALLSATSLFTRYRRASAVEREQIKWLLYACALFAGIYFLVVWVQYTQNNLQNQSGVLLGLALLAIPIAIAVAILRYRLWDIDLIIRRTLVYGGLTLTLGLVYFGSVLLLQNLSEILSGQSQSPIVIVISTLAIAALFNPLRRRIQNDIDRRFYRQKYDAEKALAEFAAAARAETDLDALSTQVVTIVEKTMQPIEINMRLKQITIQEPTSFSEDFG
jgi:MFS family permease